MKTETVYVESSVISYLTGRPGSDVVITARQSMTVHWWHNKKQKFELFISAMVIADCNARYCVLPKN